MGRLMFAFMTMALYFQKIHLVFKKLKVPLLFLLILLPSVSALTINDIIFYSSVSNYTIHVDSATLDNVTVTNLTIEFYNVSSVGSNFTNVNATYDARADFYGLDVGLVIRNINTSTDLFVSSVGNQDYSATFSSGQVIRILSESESAEVVNNFIAGLIVFGAFFGAIILVILGVTILDLFRGREVNFQKLVKSSGALITVAIIVLLGIAVIGVIGTFI